MAAPTPVARIVPVGWKMPDGYQTLVAFQRSPQINLWEKTVKPPGANAGGGIDTTTMLNSKYRTRANKHLITLDDLSFRAAYDPDVYIDILTNILNWTQAISVIFPDHSSLTFWGFLDKFEPQEHKEGDMPEADCTIIVTNTDPITFVEAGPVFTAAPGT
jgi:hypothetical protein